jgi:acetamidase/formamidase
MKEHTLNAEPTHSVWNRDLEPRLVIASGDTVSMECLDASGAQVRPDSTVEDLLAIDRTRIHALTGPIWIDGAEPGDVLQIDVLDVAHKGWAWTSIISGLGFLYERFNEPYLFHWQLEAQRTRSLAPAIVPLRPFCGVMGVAPDEVSAGATLYLPVMNAGALFSAGDAHAAQGDGEVCINGMECPADVRLRFHLHKQQPLAGPMVESAARLGEDGAAWIIVESGVDALEAARVATSRMIDLLMQHWSFSDTHAYLLCSVAMDLRFSQVVNRPMVTVSASIAKSILPERKLF